MFTQVSRPYLARTVPMSSANDAQGLLPMSSLPSCPSSRTAVFRIFLALMPVSCSASYSCLPLPLARHHLALRLVITFPSRSSSLRSHARVFCEGVFRGMNQEISEGDLKTNLKSVQSCRRHLSIKTYRFSMI